MKKIFVIFIILMLFTSATSFAANGYTFFLHKIVSLLEQISENTEGCKNVGR